MNLAYNRKRVSRMTKLLIVLIAWFALVRWVFPRLGVPT
jgi:hypothetical protein